MIEPIGANDDKGEKKDLIEHKTFNVTIGLVECNRFYFMKGQYSEDQVDDRERALRLVFYALSLIKRSLSGIRKKKQCAERTKLM